MTANKKRNRQDGHPSGFEPIPHANSEGTNIMTQPREEVDHADYGDPDNDLHWVRKIYRGRPSASALCGYQTKFNFDAGRGGKGHRAICPVCNLLYRACPAAEEVLGDE